MFFCRGKGKLWARVRPLSSYRTAVPCRREHTSRTGASARKRPASGIRSGKTAENAIRQDPAGIARKIRGKPGKCSGSAGKPAKGLKRAKAATDPRQEKRKCPQGCRGRQRSHRVQDLRQGSQLRRSGKLGKDHREPVKALLNDQEACLRSAVHRIFRRSGESAPEGPEDL